MNNGGCTKRRVKASDITSARIRSSLAKVRIFELPIKCCIEHVFEIETTDGSRIDTEDGPIEIIGEGNVLPDIFDRGDCMHPINSMVFEPLVSSAAAFHRLDAVAVSLQPRPSDLNGFTEHTNWSDKQKAEQKHKLLFLPFAQNGFREDELTWKTSCIVFNASGDVILRHSDFQVEKRGWLKNPQMCFDCDGKAQWHYMDTDTVKTYHPCSWNPDPDPTYVHQHITTTSSNEDVFAREQERCCFKEQEVRATPQQICSWFHINVDEQTAKVVKPVRFCFQWHGIGSYLNDKGCTSVALQVGQLNWIQLL